MTKQFETVLKMSWGCVEHSQTLFYFVHHDQALSCATFYLYSFGQKFFCPIFTICLLLRVWATVSPSVEKCAQSPSLPPRVISSAPQGRALNGTHRGAKFITCFTDMILFQNFTLSDFQATNFTPQISPNFNSFSEKTQTSHCFWRN